MSVPSTSKKAPTPGPAGLSSTSCTMWAGSAMAAGAGTIPPPPSPGRAVRLPARLRAWVQSAPVAALPSPSPPMEDPDRWPPADGRRVVFLLDASSGLERRLLEDWIARSRPAEVTAAGYDVVSIPPSRRQRRRRRRRSDARLEGTLAVGDDPLLAPLRVAWLPPKRDGVPRARLARLLSIGDPRDPGRLRQARVLRRHPDRCRVVVAEPAPASELRARWHRAGGTDAAHTAGLPEFVARQAALALDRAERRLRGARYKVPRFVQEEIVGRAGFRGAVARLARRLGRDEASVTREARRYLREIAASHSPRLIHLAANLIRFMYTRGYGETLHYDHAQLAALAALGQRHPLVFLPSHKSNLDSLVLKYALYENGLPPNHTAGGINMNFFPMGAIMRRTGIFFIRRSFKDNDVYKLVLRQYIDYLIEKRFPLEWYMEGTRSRSGKLMPPRFGLLAYVVDAYRRGKSDDVLLIPVSIAYDQIQDVAGYAAEERGGTKQPESFGWFLRFVRALRRQYGEIYIRFGEPLSLARALGPPDPGAEPDPNEQSLVLQKTAFDVAVRINRVTPITAISLVTLTLLGTGNRALSVDETIVRLRNLLDYVRRRNLPTAGDLRLDTRDGVQHALDALVENGVVTCFAGGTEAVYLIGPEKHLIASYYRNTIIHFFVTGAIAELALLRAAEADVADPAAEFWDEAMRLRDLLKFEFFFAEKDAFRDELRDEIRLHDPDWESRLGEGPAAIEALLRRFRPFSAHRVLRPFVEAYRVVADALERRPPANTLGEEEFLRVCLALGQQYVLQRRVLSPESVSQVLFATALSLARNRGLVEPGAADLAERRRGFAEELRNVARRVDAVDALVAARHTGLID
ncbi:MAG: glycerol-3-phosphate 1-O-acyltransferase [Deltaproteobacteria bacterium]|nr:MAG: glycerol-3-phosphate 1-O-acyltransferase [Deltaproteobacteria bacterium]